MPDTPLKRNDKLMAKIAVSEARRGNLGPLIARISVPATRATMSDGEWKFIIAELEARDGTRGRKALKVIEKQLIAMRVEGLKVGEDGEKRLSPDQAVGKVMQERGIKSKQTIYNAIKESKKPK